MSATDPHHGQPVLTAGAPLTEASGGDDHAARAGRQRRRHHRAGTSAEAAGRSPTSRPDAAGNAWYPRPFMTPAAGNEPYLSSAKAVVARLIAEIGLAGIPPEKIAILGFSQGACLALEFAARNPRRYGAVLALSGGLIGDRVAPEAYSGSLAGTPVFVGCSDVDPFIPLPRVQEIGGGDGAPRRRRDRTHLPGAAHTIVPDEVANVRRILDLMVPSTAA